MKILHFAILLLAAICFVSGSPVNNARPGKDYALFFAVNDYEHMRDLENPISDAQKIAKELEDYYGFKTEVVKNPTMDEIERKLQEYKSLFTKNAGGQYASDGQLLIFFTGHGVVENRNGYFLAKDSEPGRLYRTALAYEIWRPFLDEIDCKHVLVCIDACFSGTFDPGWWSRTDFGRPGELSEGEKLLATHELYTTRKFFTSATEVETPDRSNFARKFLEGLQSRGGKDGILTSTELFTFLEQSSPRPHHGDFGIYEAGSSFLFILDNPLATRTINTAETDALAKDLQAWKTARETHTLLAYQQYLQQFPAGEFRGLAIAAAQELERDAAAQREELQWEITKEKNTKPAYEQYLSEYPQGRYAPHARQRIKDLDTPPELPNMVFIQGGTFEMGDVWGDGQNDEKPVHTVALSDYYLGRMEVTNQEFVEFLNDISSRLSVDENKELIRLNGNIIYDLICTGCSSWKDRITPTGNRYTVLSGFEQHPLAMVPWYGAVEYCNWRSKRESLQPVYTINGTSVTANWNANGYRLPTEAEWEYAARSRGKKEKWAGTSEESSLSRFANYKGKSDGYESTAPVRSLSPNALGLYDMSGNVWEWCWDWKDTYPSGSVTNPKGPASGTYRVVRGGSWDGNPTYCRVANRDDHYPDYRYSGMGFRLCRVH